MERIEGLEGPASPEGPANPEGPASPASPIEPEATTALKPVDEPTNSAKPAVRWSWLLLALGVLAATLILTMPTGGYCVDGTDTSYCTSTNLLGADPAWPWQLAGFAAATMLMMKSCPDRR